MAGSQTRQATGVTSAGRGRLLRVVPGIMAALLFASLLLRPLFGVVPVALAAVALLAAVAVQPMVRERAGQLARWQELPHWLALLGIVALGAALRFTGVRFGLPYLEHPDEWATADPALRMLQTADYNPGSFVYPSLTTYLQLGVALVHFLWGAGAGLYTTVNDLAPAHFYPWGRTFTALLGTLALPLTYALGRMLYDRNIGLLGAAMLAVYPAASGDAHYITTDTPSMFFSLLALLAVAWAAGDRQQVQPWRLLVAGVAVGLAVSTKYNVAVLVLPLLLAVATQTSYRLRSLLYALLAVALGFTLGTPFWLAQLPQLVNDLASIVIHYRITGHPGAEADLPALFYWDALVANGALLAWAFLGGIVLAFVRRRWADVLLLAFLVPSLLQLASVRVVFFRNLVPLLPVLCLLAAALVVLASQQVRHRRVQPQFVVVALAVLLLLQPLAIAARDEWLRLQPTTRVLATEWVENEVPAGSLLWFENYTLTVSERFRVRGGEPVTTNPPEWYRENGFSYLVVDRDARVRQQDAAQLAAFGEPMISFAADGQRHGPTFSVYATGLDASQDERTASGATLGQGALILEGFRHGGVVAPGGVLPLALYWQANRALPADYVVFVHLVDGNNTKLAQRDTPPLDGARPTTTWTAGELIRDDANLVIPATVAPGTYTLLVGMYDPQTMATINDNGPIVLGQVEVRP